MMTSIFGKKKKKIGSKQCQILTSEEGEPPILRVGEKIKKYFIVSNSIPTS